MARLKVTREKYEFREIQSDHADKEACALFVVDLPSGQSRDELLTFTMVETRIRLWEDAVQELPALTWQDVQGFCNYRQYIRALVEALKYQVI